MEKIIFFGLIGVCLLIVVIIFIGLLRQFNKLMRLSQLYSQALKKEQEREQQKQMRLQEEQKKIVLSTHSQEGA